MFLFLLDKLTANLTFVCWYNMRNRQLVYFHVMTNYIYLAAAYLLFLCPLLSPSPFIAVIFPIYKPLSFVLSSSHSVPHHTYPPSYTHTFTPKLKAIDRPQEPDKIPRAPHDRKKEWQKLALGAELAQDIPEDKHREANGSAAYHDNRYVTAYL